jgi:hypothetical protein
VWAQSATFPQVLSEFFLFANYHILL